MLTLTLTEIRSCCDQYHAQFYQLYVTVWKYLSHFVKQAWPLIFRRYMGHYILLHEYWASDPLRLWFSGIWNAYFYSKTNQMHNILNLFYFGTMLCMFRLVPPSIVRGLRLYIQHLVYVIQVLWLPASKQPQDLYDIYQMLYVQS
jgi:hypothetical protein